MARTSAEASLGQDDSLYRAVVDTAVDAIVVINRNGLMRSVNRTTERVFGYTADEMVGRNVNMLMPQPYADEHDSYLESYLRTGARKIIGIGREISGKRKDGSIFPMELSVGETHDGGEPIFVGIIRDITAHGGNSSCPRHGQNGGPQFVGADQAGFGRWVATKQVMMPTTAVVTQWVNKT